VWTTDPPHARARAGVTAARGKGAVAGLVTGDRVPGPDAAASATVDATVLPATAARASRVSPAKVGQHVASRVVGRTPASVVPVATTIVRALEAGFAIGLTKGASPVRRKNERSGPNGRTAFATPGDPDATNPDLA